jgi:hypothetical protein
MLAGFQEPITNGEEVAIEVAQRMFRATLAGLAR